ncbi:hypothetical protein FA13DRAFT_1708225 [Coprinellus micaceus]|uniref:DUF7918 domain-containing protein n=1 Tax=Coprinellus micaceus TaxID=71717 RepID=A0A4Y7TGV4_COPMI|nr:hypothetical protein FA13DRAFT_1708225 [Coprinellus micaceus]
MPLSPQGFEAWIEVDGRRLEEFKIEMEWEKVVCWVPCEAGKEFAIGCSLPWYKVCTTNHAIKVHLDGKVPHVVPNLVRQDWSLDPATRLFKEELVNGGASIRAFQFGALELTGDTDEARVFPDDDALLDGPTPQFGEISVHFSSAQAFVPIQDHPGAIGNFKEDYRAHERSKKLGEEKPRIGGAPIWNMALGIKGEFTFVFKYRPMDVLVADGIAPRGANQPRENAAASGSTAPQIGLSSSKRKWSEVKEEGEDDKVARSWFDPMDDEIERMENELATMKAKRAQGESTGSQPLVKRVKQEHMSAFGPGEVIDLADLLSGAHVKPESKVLFCGELIDLT